MSDPVVSGCFTRTSRGLARVALGTALLGALYACGGGEALRSSETAMDLDVEEDGESQAAVDYGMGLVTAAGALTETLKALAADGVATTGTTPPAGTPQACSARCSPGR